MARCLDFHASYRCRHAGACCQAAWTIPFEDGTIAARDTHGGCSFFDATTNLCAIHGTHGMQALPVTCRMFPRIVLHDVRGTFISLSHFCPTAARLLFDAAGDAAIVEAPQPLAGVGELDGLDARGDWPPLLRAGVLMDPDSYGEWERRAVSLLTAGDASPEDALGGLEETTARLTAWKPATGALLDAVHAAFEGVASGTGPRRAGADAAVKRWLAARLFGAWTAYQGAGLAATLRYLRACLQTFTRERDADGDALEAIRRSDLRILHGSAPIDLSLNR